MSDFLINRELKELERDKALVDNELKVHRSQYAEMLRGELGKDIDDVINGRTYVKLTWREKLSRFINKVFNIL